MSDVLHFIGGRGAYEYALIRQGWRVEYKKSNAPRNSARKLVRPK